MPKLTNHWFVHETKDKQRHSFEGEIHVSTDGEFSCTVPDYLVPTLDAVGKPYNAHRPTHYTRKLKVNYRAYGPSKAELISYINAALADYYRAEEIVELVICYDWFSEVSYWVRPDGSICENGAVKDSGAGKGGNWAENIRRDGYTINGSTNGIQHFSVGLYAAIYKRVIYRRSSGDTIRYERLREYGDKEWASRLNGFAAISPPKDVARLKHMPLTEEAARFFYESMIAMCEIGRRFSNFFGNETNIIAAIEGRGPSLLTGPQAAPELESK